MTIIDDIRQKLKASTEEDPIMTFQYNDLTVIIKWNPDEKMYQGWYKGFAHGIFNSDGDDLLGLLEDMKIDPTKHIF